MYMNQLTIIGFTGRDADFHCSQNGTPVTTLSVATKESWKNSQGEWQSHTEWHGVVAFGKLAEYAKTLAKGSHVLVQGALHSREYEKDGRSTALSNFARIVSENLTARFAVSQESLMTIRSNLLGSPVHPGSQSFFQKRPGSGPPSGSECQL